MSTLAKKKYLNLIRHYESCFEAHGDTVQGVDWPNLEDARKRYRVMLDLIRFMPERFPQKERYSLLDFGCGTSHLYEYIREQNLDHIEYSGLDLSEKFIARSREKHPSNRYYQLDIIEDGVSLPEFDFIVINGVFTEKRDLSFNEMFEFFKNVIRKLYPNAGCGLAFNVMSKEVDWERDDLFHLPMDDLAGFLTDEISRDFIIRNDYQLYEYTTYIYRELQ